MLMRFGLDRKLFVGHDEGGGCFDGDLMDRHRTYTHMPGWFTAFGLALRMPNWLSA